MPTPKYKPLPDVLETFRFSTDIARPPDSEYRTARSEMRVLYEMTYRLTDAQHAAFYQELLDNLRVDWDVPLWTQRDRGRVQSSGTTTIVEQSLRDAGDYRDGSKMVLWDGCDAFEVFDIEVTPGGTMRATTPATLDYTNAALMPANPAIIAGPIQVDRTFPGFIDTTVTWMLREPGDHAATAWGVYDGEQVLECASAFISPAGGVLTPNTEYVDSGFGRITLVEGRQLHDQTFAAHVIEHQWPLRQFWQTIEGRNHPFWVKEWGGSLEVSAALAASSTIDIVETKAAADMVGKHVVIDGIYREILGATGTGTVTLTLDSALGADVAAGAPASTVVLVRAETDDLEIEHVHGFSSSTRFPVIEDRAA